MTATADELRDVAGRAYSAAMRLRLELKFLYERDGECLGDHKNWMARIKALLDETRDFE